MMRRPMVGLLGLVSALGILSGRAPAADDRIATKTVEHLDGAAFGDIGARFAHVERVRLTGAEVRSRITLLDRFAAVYTDASPSEFTADVEFEIVEVLQGKPAHDGRIHLRQRVGRGTTPRGPTAPGLFRLIHLGPYERELYLAYNDLRRPTLLEGLTGAPQGEPRRPPQAAGGTWPRCDVLAAAADIPAGSIIRRGNLTTRQVFTTFGHIWFSASDDRFDHSDSGMWAPGPIRAGHILSPGDMKMWQRVLVAAKDIAAGSELRADALSTVLVKYQEGIMVVMVPRLGEFDVSAWRAGRGLRAGDFLEPADMQADLLKTTVTLNPGDVIRREHLTAVAGDGGMTPMTYVPASRIDQVVGRKVTGRWPIQARSFLCRDRVDYPPYRPAPSATFRNGETLCEYRPQHTRIRPAATEKPAPPAATLEEAAGRGDLDALRRFLAEAKDSRAAEGFGQAALEKAVAGGRDDAVRLLVADGVGIDGRKDGPTPLMSAVMSQHPEMVDLLVGLGADVEARRMQGATAMIVAGNGGKTEAARWLLRHGADVNASYRMAGSWDWTALSGAIMGDYMETATFLLEHGATPTTGAVYQAVARGNPRILQLLADHGADMRARWESSRSTRGTPETEGVVHLAAGMGRREALEWLLAHGASPDERGGGGDTPLMYAVEGRHLATVNCLLEHGADVNATNKIGMTALMRAAQVGDEAVDIVQALLDHGADPGIEWHGRTALSIAAEFEHPRCMERIVKNGDPTDARALINAAAQRSPDGLALLLRKGARADAADAHGRTALMAAASKGYADNVALLLKHGAKVDLRDQGGCTALIYAAKGNALDVVPMLLAHGADRKIKNADGLTAADLAPSQEMKKLLRK